MKQTTLFNLVFAGVGLVSAAPTTAANLPSEEPSIISLREASSSDHPAAAILQKRATHTPGGRNDYCGEAVPVYNTNPNSPLAVDCRNIPLTSSPANISGFWTISKQESEGFKWITLGQSGTCAFRVRLMDGYGQTARRFWFGTNDLRFYVNSHTYTNVDSVGRVQVQSGVYCSDGTDGGFVYLDWGVFKV
ncbi:hypothetical protein QBC35DRAFT_509959 [Podospora australis]|uniref:Ecp2 effector protein-like domain-containing protein n=1 Tax=Podospora australis TaxID=1536484 RepID=A0AAN7AE29_9PEZI|nr:hypothetical protein QBC35DRAFT_509959 [Podospora australis]